MEGNIPLYHRGSGLILAMEIGSAQAFHAGGQFSKHRHLVFYLSERIKHSENRILSEIVRENNGAKQTSINNPDRSPRNFRQEFK